MTYPDDPHARLRAAERDIEHYVGLLGGGGLTSADKATAFHYIEVAAKELRAATEQLMRSDQGISLALCKHPHPLLIGREIGPNGRRAHACLCQDCGSFVVSINGERMTFALVSDEQVVAAGLYAQVLSAGIKKAVNE